MMEFTEIADEPEVVLPSLEVADEGPDYARLVAEPLEAGYGITLGNTLRRVLLGSLEGAAITSVRIEQVQHEFSTIEGMREDTTDFLLSLKEVRLRAITNRPGTITLDAEGSTRLTAGDLRIPADFELVNPDLYLATLDGASARLNVTMNVQVGKGYVPAGSVEGLPIGVIPVDAVFTPIRKVNYKVEKTRVGQSTDFDRLVLEVWTDGTIGPVEAVGLASDILMEQFALFSTAGGGSAQAPAAPGTEGSPVGRILSPERYNTAIEELSLSVRAYNCLKRSGLMTVGQVLEKTEDELLGLRNFGRKSYDELRERLVDLQFIDGEQPGLVPVAADGSVATAERGQAAQLERPPDILDEDDEEESLGALGKALREALREVGNDDLLGADDEE
ncbi:MAG: DNA-directed RNA polymerase subunit alpha [Dehalococcoidia bacterium]